MKTITVKELKANWARIEEQVKAGETFEVLNRGKVAAHIVPAAPRQVCGGPTIWRSAYRNDGSQGLGHRPRAAGRTRMIYLDTSAFIKLYLFEDGCLCDASLFVTADWRQAALAGAGGRPVKLVSPATPPS